MDDANVNVNVTVRVGLTTGGMGWIDWNCRGCDSELELELALEPGASRPGRPAGRQGGLGERCPLLSRVGPAFMQEPAFQLPLLQLPGQMR